MSKEAPFIKFFDPSSKFVFYNDLQRTYPQVYNYLSSFGGFFEANHNSHMLKIAAQLRGFANVEAQKEIRLLQEFFGSSLSLQPGQMYDSSFGKQLIEAMNGAMQFKSMYERALTRINGIDGKQGTAKITAAQFLSSYFGTALADIARRSLPANAADYTMEQLGDIIFSDRNIAQALEESVFERLKNSGDWSKNDENKGYKEFLETLDSQKYSTQKNMFLQSLYDSLKLDELREHILEQIESSEKMAEIFSEKKLKNRAGLVQKSLHQSTTMKGTIAEIFGQTAMQVAANEFGSGGATSSVVGASGGKADIVATFGFDYSKVSDTIEKYYENRPERVAAFKTLNEKLRKLKDGFIVYTNAKDYSLIRKPMSNGYMFNGFSAGSAISLSSLEGVIANTPGGSKNIIAHIMSTMEGAVFSDLKGQIQEELASKMAYFLFDDVTTIGVEGAAADHAIHLMLLDGVYIPLSYMFVLMSEAIETVEAEISVNPTDILEVTIDAGSIAYPTGNPSGTWQWEEGSWESQKNIAYNQIKISARFLKNFIDVIGSLRM